MWGESCGASVPKTKIQIKPKTRCAFISMSCAARCEENAFVFKCRILTAQPQQSTACTQNKKSPHSATNPWSVQNTFTVHQFLFYRHDRQRSTTIYIFIYIFERIPKTGCMCVSPAPVLWKIAWGALTPPPSTFYLILLELDAMSCDTFCTSSEDLCKSHPDVQSFPFILLQRKWRSTDFAKI